MRDLLLLAIHLFVTVAKLLRPGGVRAVAAESLLLKQQLLVSEVIGPMPQIAPKKHRVASLWHCGMRRRGRPMQQWCALPAR
jgi:hypothetical protein